MAPEADENKTALQLEVDAARTVVESAEKNLATTEKSLKSLQIREKKAAAKLADLQARAKQNPAVRKTKSYAATKMAATQATAMRRRNEKLIQKLKPDVKDKRQRLRRLERQIASLQRELKALHGRAPATIPTVQLVATGEQIRGARAMLAMAQAEFAKAVGISLNVLRKAERSSGSISDNDGSLGDIVAGLSRLGVELINPGIYVGNGGPGIRLRKRSSKSELASKLRKKPAARKQRRPAASRAA